MRLRPLRESMVGPVEIFGRPDSRTLTKYCREAIGLLDGEELQKNPNKNI